MTPTAAPEDRTPVADQLIAVARRLEEVADRLTRVAEQLQGPDTPPERNHRDRP